MDTSDDPTEITLPGFLAKKSGLFDKPDPPDIQPGREIFTDPNLLEPQKKKKKQRAARTVLTDDFAPPILGSTGVLGLDSQVV